MKHYDIIIIGAGPGGIFAAYELQKLDPSLKTAVFESGHSLYQLQKLLDYERIRRRRRVFGR